MTSSNHEGHEGHGGHKAEFLITETRKKIFDHGEHGGLPENIFKTKSVGAQLAAT